MANLEKANREVVNVVNSAGNDAIPVTYTKGDTVASILKKAGITLAYGETVTLGRKRIKNVDKTTVQPNDTLVIASKVSNG